MITINADKKTIHRNGGYWTYADTGLPKFFARIVEQYGAEEVGNVLTQQNQYPPMINAADRREIEDTLEERSLAAAYVMHPEIRDGLEKLGGYTAKEAAEALAY